MNNLSAVQKPLSKVSKNFELGFPVPKYESKAGGAGLRNTRPQACTTAVVGRAMVLGSFQCRGVLLPWHMVGQGPDVLAAGAGRVACFFLFVCFCFVFFISPILSFSNASSLGRRWTY